LWQHDFEVRFLHRFTCNVWHISILVVPYEDIIFGLLFWFYMFNLRVYFDVFDGIFVYFESYLGSFGKLRWFQFGSYEMMG